MKIYKYTGVSSSVVIHIDKILHNKYQECFFITVLINLC
jgi:hypothetical protein